MLKRHFAQSTESENLSQDTTEKCFECKNRDADQVKIQMYKSSAMVLRFYMSPHGINILLQRPN